jgi:hypothetical protein
MKYKNIIHNRSFQLAFTTLFLMEIGWEDVAWMHVTQDRDQWWTLVDTVTNLSGS